MTDYELDIVRKAMLRSLAAGAPGLSELMRGSIVSDAMRTINRQLGIPAPELPSAQCRED